MHDRVWLYRLQRVQPHAINRYNHPAVLAAFWGLALGYMGASPPDPEGNEFCVV
jgi:hypothetical protein